MSTDSIIIIYVIQLLKYIMLMSICSSVLFMFGNENKLKLEKLETVNGVLEIERSE